MPRYDYRIRLIGGSLDKVEYATGTIWDEVSFPTVWTEKIGDGFGIRSTGGKLMKSFDRGKYPRWIDVLFMVYRKEEGQESPRVWRYNYSHSFVMYRCSGITKQGHQCAHYVDAPDGKCRQHCLA